MQVSHMDELDSHAVIGGAKALAFGISDSPEFFTILSKTLYRDEKLAVVRETVCNADDAHKMVDKTDVAIEITLTDEELVIKDFGPGIPDDKMQPIYCVYGNSTKVKDDKATGGFGLGCKAPFAYSDHFTVTSCNNGFKSVYAISRGGIETDGKPSLIRMVKAPTTETGITVSIPLKDRKDRPLFERLIKRVVMQGGILARLNGLQLPHYNLAQLEKTGYGLVSSAELNESPVYIRYGAVMYPLTTENPKLMDLVGRFRTNNYLTLVIQAAPGSVGVTPSREALSYSEQTTATLMELLPRITTEIQKNKNAANKELAKRYVASTTTPQIALSWAKTSPGILEFTADPLEVAMHLVHRSQTGYLPAFKVSDSDMAKQVLKAAARKYRDHRRTFRRLMHIQNRQRFGRQWDGSTYHPDHSKLLLRMVLKLGIFEQLMRYGTPSEGERTDSGRYRYPKTGIYQYRRILGSYAVKPTIVVCRGKDQADGYMANVSWDSKKEFAFIIARYLKPAQIEELKAALKTYKFEHKILDLAPPAPKPKKPKVQKPKEKFYSFSSIITGTETPQLRREHRDDPTKLIDWAPYFIDMKTTITSTEMYRHEVREILKCRKTLEKAYPNVALAYGAAQKKALLAAGSKPLDEAIAEDILALKDTPAILFAANCADGDICARDYGETLATMVRELAKRDLRFGKLFTRQSPDLAPEETKAFALFKVSDRISFGDGGKARKHALELKQKALKKQRKKDEFDFLKPLVPIYGPYGGSPDIEFSEDLMELIRFLQKRADKHAKTTIQPKSEPMKEAA